MALVRPQIQHLPHIGRGLSLNAESLFRGSRPYPARLSLATRVVVSSTSGRL